MVLDDVPRPGIRPGFAGDLLSHDEDGPPERTEQVPPKATPMALLKQTREQSLAGGVAVGDKDEQPSSDLFKTAGQWPEEVDGAELLDQGRAILQRTIVMSNATAIATVLWILHTWVVDSVRCSPFAHISAPQRRCGKTTLLEVMSRLCKNSMAASNVSVAALFRMIERYQPTLCLDEVDTWLLRDEILRGILNAGHTRETAYVVRVERSETVKRPVFGPKILCGIGQIPATLQDRAILIQLSRKLPEQRIERLRDIPPREFDELKAKMARWAEDHGREIAAARPEFPSALNDREADNWECLFAIADLAGGKWPVWARKAAVAVSQLASEINDGDDEPTELLRNIREAFVDRRADRLSTTDLIRYLTNDPHLRWCDYSNGRPLTPRHLAEMLRLYRIRPQTIRNGTATMKGYYREQFTVAWRSFLPHQQGGG